MNYQFENQSLPDFVKAYLKKYGGVLRIPEIAGDRKYQNIVVIPAIKEFENIRALLNSLSEMDDNYIEETLFLFVVNNGRDANGEIKTDNLRTIELLRTKIQNTNHEIDPTKKNINKKINVGLIDASTSGYELPDKDAGVGLARKIGMDIALTLFDYSCNQNKNIICLDADCTVAPNYLREIVKETNEKKIVAGYVQYEHKLPEDEIEKHAIVCYEIFLRYYNLGLKYAGSHFSFAAIGSTMFCDAESYCRVGGMNKRKAAEDFYFLEKLAKITSIKLIDSTRVYPASRRSWRVPFGTGQRINRFIAQTHDEYALYNPKIFSVLKNWLEIFTSTGMKNSEEYLAEAAEINPQLFAFLEMNSFKEDWQKIMSNSKSGKQVEKQKLIWFDGFRTLKLVHFLRDNGLGLVGMFDAVDELFTLSKINYGIYRTQNIPPLETQIKYLQILRENT